MNIKEDIQIAKEEIGVQSIYKFPEALSIDWGIVRDRSRWKYIN